MVNNIYIVFMGVVIILTILITLAIFVSILSNSSRKALLKKAALTNENAKTVQSNDKQAIDQETVAVISAAVSACVGKRFQLKSIHERNGLQENNAWKAQAKREAVMRQPKKNGFR